MVKCNQLTSLPFKGLRLPVRKQSGPHSHNPGAYTGQEKTESSREGVEQLEKIGGGADDDDVLRNLSAGIWYWLATNLDTEASSSRKICMRMNGSRPF